MWAPAKKHIMQNIKIKITISGLLEIEGSDRMVNKSHVDAKEEPCVNL